MKKMETILTLILFHIGCSLEELRTGTNYFNSERGERARRKETISGLLQKSFLK